MVTAVAPARALDALRCHAEAHLSKLVERMADALGRLDSGDRLGRGEVCRHRR
ncbi:hypothetical protein [Streptomyces sp. MAI_2237]